LPVYSTRTQTSSLPCLRLSKGQQNLAGL
jgi:hypothetical protein